jgi:flavin reductase (DIM6/NTAB) family NADH-FMN oxidoreductase RutF
MGLAGYYGRLFMLDLHMSDPLAQSLKLGMRRLATSVCIVTAVGDQGDAQAMTVSSVSSVSADPASLLVCVNRDSRFAPLIATGVELVVNVLHSSHQDLAQLCANPNLHAQRLAHKAWNWLANLPYLADAEAVFFTRIDTVVPYGTHLVVIAQVERVLVSSAPLSPLLYADGAYRILGN